MMYRIGAVVVSTLMIFRGIVADETGVASTLEAKYFSTFQCHDELITRDSAPALFDIAFANAPDIETGWGVRKRRYSMRILGKMFGALRHDWMAVVPGRPGDTYEERHPLACFHPDTASDQSDEVSLYICFLLSSIPLC